MKKLLIIAAAALLAAACAKTYEVKETTPPAIGFGTWAEQLTKSRASGTTSFVNGDKFNVYGYKTVNSTTSVVFNGDEVSYASSAWSYSPIRFWDPTASEYGFYAVMPESLLAAESSADLYGKEGKFTSSNFTFSNTTPTDNSMDVLVASKNVRQASGNPSVLPTGIVQLDFNHIASLVDIKVKKDAAMPADAILRITTATLINIKNQGTFTVASYDASNNNKPVIGSTNYGWVASSAAAVTYTANATLPLDITYKTTYDDGTGAATGSTDSGNTAATSPDDFQDLFTGYILMPQDINLASDAPALHLVYKIVTQEADTANNKPEVATEYTTDVPIKAFVTTDSKNNPTPVASTSWNPGTHYIYTLTIGANAISFSASINDWVATPVTGYHYLIN